MDSVNKKVAICKNFISKEDRELLFTYCRLKHIHNVSNFDPMIKTTEDTSCYSDPLFEHFLLSKQKKMEEITGLELWPTYSYWRIYTHGAVLRKHTDVKSCEISVTINVKQDEHWPIFIGGEKVDLNEGDAAIYKGRKFEHHREAFTGDYACQFFLHYVDKNGEFAEYKYDKRDYIGQPARPWVTSGL